MVTKKSKPKAKTKASAGKSGKKYGTLHELLILKLQSLYDVEQELIKALPKLAKAATSGELRQAFEMHLRETTVQAARLEEALQLLNVAPKKEKTAGIRGIAEDGTWVAGHASPEVRDAALIAAAQYAEHYEIAGYTSAREWAAMMDHKEVTDLLDATLIEEQNASAKLAELAHNGINQRAGGIPMDDATVEEEEIALM
jgi:ferritin-like metal-binding protein YciE